MGVGLQKAVSQVSPVRPPSGLPHSVSHSTPTLCVYMFFPFGKRLCWWCLTVFYLLSSAASLTVDISEMEEDQGAVLSRL